MKKVIAVLSGDGIGPEIMPYAVKVIQIIAEKFHQSFEIRMGEVGGSAFEKYGVHFPKETQALCENADAVLFGSVGGPIHEAHLPKWKDCERNSILALRKSLNLSVNLRPMRVYPALKENCPLKENRIATGIDILILRELLGDIYFGEHTRYQREGVQYAKDVAEYSETQIRCIAKKAFEFALKRRKKLTSVDKANVLETSRLWREIISETAKNYPDVTWESMLVDNCAMQLVQNPAQFDVIVTSNLFGDILSDEAAAIPGSLGLMPSASLTQHHTQVGFGLYEPSGGSAPGIAGKNIANPIAQILSAAMLLRYSFGMEQAANGIESAVEKTLSDGFRTPDIYTEGTVLLGTAELSQHIINNLTGE